jgi:hypothetical protein
MCSTVFALIACSKKDPSSSAAAGSAETASPPAGSAQPAAAAEPPAPTEPESAPSDGSDEIVKMVVRDVGSKALGGQQIDASCVSVAIVPAGEWTVAAARLNDCGDKTARSIVWLYKRKTGNWNEDYVGQPPKCWKGVPPDIAKAVAIATKIPTC